MIWIVLVVLGLAANVVLLAWRMGRLEVRVRHLEAVLRMWEPER